MTGPLDGLLVVDLSWGAPGSIFTMMLADYGARVVKVERPGGGPDRDINARKAWDRGKWSIEADLEVPTDISSVFDLIEVADVMVESFGMGRATELGLGYEDIKKRNPGLVYVSITGYGADDNPWATRSGYDSLVAARMGFMAEQLGHRDGPIFLGHPSVSYTTALLSAMVTLAALRSRSVTGSGQMVDVSLLDGVIAQACMNWWYTTTDESYLSEDKKGWFGTKRLVIDMYQCADGEYLMVHTGGRKGSFKTLMEVLGIGDRFRTIEGVPEDSVPLNEAEYKAARVDAPERWRLKTRNEWLELLEAADVAVVPVLRPEELFNDSQVQHARMITHVPDLELGHTKQIGPGIRFSSGSSAIVSGAPELNQHGPQIDALIKSRAASTTRPTGQTLDHPLSGVRVIDLSSYFAASYGTKFLADLGADVVKLEPPEGDPMRVLPDPFEGSGRGKRSITADLSTSDGKQVLFDLVRGADVVVHNLRPGKAEKLGIDYSSLREHNQNLIYCYQPGWGVDGPRSHLKSFAPLVSAFTGLMYDAAGADNPPVLRARASEDYYAGFLGAVAVLMALHHRAATGDGQYLECPQLHASLFVVSDRVLGPDGTLLPRVMLDKDQMGLSPLYRLYQTTDGWVCIAAVGERAFNRTNIALGIDASPYDYRAMQIGADPTAQSEAYSSLLAAKFSGLLTTEAVARLEAQEVPVEEATQTPYMPQFFWDEWALQSHRVFEHPYHKEFGYIREVGLPFRLSSTPPKINGPAPLLGEHTREVLSELGYEPVRIDELVEDACRAADRRISSEGKVV